MDQVICVWLIFCRKTLLLIRKVNILHAHFKFPIMWIHVISNWHVSVHTCFFREVELESWFKHCIGHSVCEPNYKLRLSADVCLRLTPQEIFKLWVVPHRIWLQRGIWIQIYTSFKPNSVGGPWKNCRIHLCLVGTICVQIHLPLHVLIASNDPLNTRFADFFRITNDKYMTKT